MLHVVCGIPLGASPVSFEGFADFIGAKDRGK